MFQISDEGIDHIKLFEGLSLDSYQDVAGIWTIGYGHTGPEVGPGMTITNAEAEQILRDDVSTFENAVNSSVNVPIAQAMFDALVSLTFNIGGTNFRRSTALRRLNSEEYEGAADAITWWNKARVGGELQVVAGLVRRRASEAALFLRDLDEIGGERLESSNADIRENPPRRNNPITTRTTGGAATSGAAGAAGAGAVLMDNDDDSDAAAPETTDDTGTDDTTTEMSDGAETETEAPDTTTDDMNDAGDADTESDASAEDSMDDATDTEMSTGTEQPADMQATPDKKDYTDAFIIAMGVLAVLAALYVISARIDDWRKYRR